MGRLHSIRLKYDAFVSNIDVHIAQSINENSEALLRINKSQMLSNIDSLGKPLIHKLTGSPNLSLAYSLKTGKLKPNLFLSGDFQDAMFLSVNENAKTWFIDSEDKKSAFLTENYGLTIFGIKDKNKAKSMNSRTFKQKFISLVLR